MKEKIGQSLRMIRVGKGYSLNEASKISGINMETLRRFEKNQTNISVNNLFLLLESYEVSLEYFFTIVRDNNHNNL